jgi:hypothetical protein
MAVQSSDIVRNIGAGIVIAVLGIGTAGESLKVTVAKFFDQNCLALPCHD